MKRVGVFTRICSAAIDGVFALILAIVSGVVAQSQTAASVVFLILWLIYSGTEVAFAGTPGKLMLGLRIARQNGENAERSRLLLRWSTKYFSLLPAIFNCFFPTGTIDMLISFFNTIILCGLLGAFNEDRLTWHDEWAGTAVWKRRRLPPLAPFSIPQTVLS